jgi:acyl carrier protein
VTTMEAPQQRLLDEIIDVLSSIAPEARDQPLDPFVPLREQLELDSMDHLHFLIALKQRLRVDVPDAEYARMRRLADLVAYVGERTGAAKS